MPWFDQELMLQSEQKGPLTEKAYLDALEKSKRLARAEGIDAVVAQHRLDAIIAPDRRTGLDYGLGERRSRYGWMFVARRGGRLPACHRARGLCSWASHRPFVLWAGLERAETA